MAGCELPRGAPSLPASGRAILHAETRRGVRRGRWGDGECDCVRKQSDVCRVSDVSRFVSSWKPAPLGTPADCRQSGQGVGKGLGRRHPEWPVPARHMECQAHRTRARVAGAAPASPPPSARGITDVNCEMYRRKARWMAFHLLSSRDREYTRTTRSSNTVGSRFETRSAGMWKEPAQAQAGRGGGGGVDLSAACARSGAIGAHAHPWRHGKSCTSQPGWRRPCRS
jgi:hypothetical protein